MVLLHWLDLCMRKAFEDSNGEVEPIDLWEEEDEADPKVLFLFIYLFFNITYFTIHINY